MALKKDFTEKNVERIRNLVKGKVNDAVGVSAGYEKDYKDYKEGDIWEEDGRNWTIKNGIKQNITKLDEAKKLHRVPMFCPSCKKIMNKKNDKDFYTIHNKCFNCVVEFEHELRKKGKWEEYQRNIKNSEIDNMINDFKSFMNQRINESNDSFMAENGDIENWVGNIDKEKAQKNIEETVSYLENLKEE